MAIIAIREMKKETVKYSLKLYVELTLFESNS